VFYLDFEGHRDDPLCRDALLGLLNRSSFLKVLGSFPAAPVEGARSTDEF
jgi:prephenate dehydratase